MKKNLYIIILILLTACQSTDRHTSDSLQLRGKIAYGKPDSIVIESLNFFSRIGISTCYIDPTIRLLQWNLNGQLLLYSTDYQEGDAIFIDDTTGTYCRFIDGLLGEWYKYADWSPSGSLILMAQPAYELIEDTLRSVVTHIPDSLSFASKWIFLKTGGSRWTDNDLEVYVTGSPNRDTRYLGIGADSLRELYKYNYSAETIVEQVTHNHVDESGFEISSDQQKIVFSHGAGKSKVTYLMNTTDTTATPIIEGEHETVRWFGKTHYLYYVRFPNPTVYVMDTDHPEKEYVLMPVYDGNIDIWAEPDSVGE